MYEIRCPQCDLPGQSSDDPLEIETLVEIHNGLVHRRSPVATSHRVRRSLFRDALAPLARTA